jgi:hypothetical protein
MLELFRTELYEVVSDLVVCALAWCDKVLAEQSEDGFDWEVLKVEALKAAELLRGWELMGIRSAELNLPEDHPHHALLLAAKWYAQSGGIRARRGLKVACFNLDEPAAA